MTRRTMVNEGQEHYETDYTPYGYGASWMRDLLVDCDDGDLHAWWGMGDFEWKQTLANAATFPHFLDDDGSLSQEAERGAWDTLQRRVIDRLVDLYNEGKDEARRVRWDKANEDFIDSDAGRWRPYLLQTWHRDLIATFETTSDLIALLKSLDVDAGMEDLEIKVDDSWWKTWFSYGGAPEA